MKKTFFNPFEIYTENKLLSISIVYTIIVSFLAPMVNTRFDGVLDLHFHATNNIFQGFIDNTINVFSLTLILFIAGKIINKKTRLVDILITSLVSRMPYYLLMFFNINDFMLEATKDMMLMNQVKSLKQIPIQSLSFTLVFSLFSIAILIWYMALLFNGFKVATNGKSKKLILLFIAGLIVAEILSKIIFSIL